MVPDLIQEGMLGLCLARNKFNESKNVGFGHYCKPYIKHRIYNYYFEHRTNGIREPHRVRMNRYKFNKKWGKEYSTGKLSDKEIMEIMNISKKSLVSITKPAPFINHIGSYAELENVIYLKKKIN